MKNTCCQVPFVWAPAHVLFFTGGVTVLLVILPERCGHHISHRYTAQEVECLWRACVVFILSLGRLVSFVIHVHTCSAVALEQRQT